MKPHARSDVFRHFTPISLRRLKALLRTNFAVWILLALSCAMSHAQTNPRYALLNINNISIWLADNGRYNNLTPQGFATSYSKVKIVYSDGLEWAGKVYTDSLKTRRPKLPYGLEVRVGGNPGLGIGNMGWVTNFGAQARRVDPSHPLVRIYRIRRDYFFMSDKELRREAAELNAVSPSNVNTEQMRTVQEQYAKDWQEWPVAFGAPFIDRNGNGVYDPPPPFSKTFTPELLLTGNFDEPGMSNATPDFPADQVIWTVHNDLPLDDRLFWSYTNLGLEAQITLWAYKSAGLLDNVVFERLRLINRGGIVIDSAGTKSAFWIDSMYVAMNSYTEIGNVGDELVGCDTLLHMGFAYNGNRRDKEFDRYKLSPPALGYVLLQGPRVPATSSDSAWFEGKHLSGWKNLSMTAFSFWSGDYLPQPEQCGSLHIRLYRRLQGHDTRACRINSYFPFPPETPPSHLPLAGDPINRKGFFDGSGTNYSPRPGPRSLTVSSGPFTFSPGDTQEVVFAFVASGDGDHLGNVAELKLFSKILRLWHPYQGNLVRIRREEELKLPNYYALSPNYPNPFTSTTRFDYTLKREAHVRVSIFDVLGREVAAIEDRIMPAGEHRASWNGRDQNNRALPSGVYFYRLQAGHVVIARKFLLVR